MVEIIGHVGNQKANRIGGGRDVMPDLTTELDLMKKRFERARAEGSQRKLASRPTSEKPVNKGVEQRRQKDLDGLEDALAKSSRIMEAKSRRYKKIKRGDAEDQILLPSSKDDTDDFDASEESGSDSEVEIIDSFGRTRKVPRAKAHLFESDDEDKDSHRVPKVARPSTVLYGDRIQHEAFELDHQAVAELAAKDPNEGLEQHYDAVWERRDRGVGFYKFSQDSKARQEQMESLGGISEEILGEDDFMALKEARKKTLDGRLEAVRAQREFTLARVAKIHSLTGMSIGRG
jgi:hypothetical protein